MARVLMVSSEAAPLAKTGGLADVVGALPAALAACGDQAAVVLPRYARIDLKPARRIWDHLSVWLGPAHYDLSVWLADAPTPIYLVDAPGLLDRAGLYGEGGADYPDNHIRFALFAKAALAIARHIFKTDILHCHDWQAGLVPVYLRTQYAYDPAMLGMRTVFTIHNLGYQGLFPASVMSTVALPAETFRPDGLEFFGQISYLKGGIMYGDALTTVSPTYAREIQTPALGFGLDGALRERAADLSGIINGVDYKEWNPETDPLIPAHYSAADLAGKRACKKALLEEFGLPEAAMDRPLIGIVSRFARQKGFDLLAEVAGRLAEEDMYLAALGTGEPEFEEFFRRLNAEQPGRIGVNVGFNNGLAHRIEAGADIFVMPSHYEPCGLNQIYSLRYGTVPVVRATGGLDDTIEEGTGFKFWEYSGHALMDALRAANAAFSNPDTWHEMMVRGMAKDFSWNQSASAYSALYRRLLKQ